MNKTLFLPLKAKWYDMIESGKKVGEFLGNKKAIKIEVIRRKNK